MGQVCPLSNASVDDAVHALVGCTFAGVSNRVAERRTTLRHDAAVLDVAGAIRGGSQGVCPLFVDVRRWVNPNVPRVLLPASSQHSVPDTFMHSRTTESLSKDRMGVQSDKGGGTGDRTYIPGKAHPGDRGKCTLHLLELKYTFDLQVHETFSVAPLQHEELVLALDGVAFDCIHLS